MKTLTWRHTDWFAKKFVFTQGTEVIGELNFYSSWNFNARYTDKETNLKFDQKSLLDRDVIVRQGDKKIGEIEHGFLGDQTLKLMTGEKFKLTSNVWGRDVRWKKQNGETIVTYQQATLSSMGKGSIHVTEQLSEETEKILISSGIFARQLVQRRIAVIVAAVVPILAASHHRV